MYNVKLLFKSTCLIPDVDKEYLELIKELNINVRKRSVEFFHNVEINNCDEIPTVSSIKKLQNIIKKSVSEYIDKEFGGTCYDTYFEGYQEIETIEPQIGAQYSFSVQTY